MANIPTARDNTTLYGNVVLASRFVQTPLIQGPGGGSQAVTVGTTEFGGTSSVIGTLNKPSSLSVGEGGQYTESMIVQSNSNGISGTWLDLTTLAVGPSNPAQSPQQFAILQGNTTNNALYIGADQVFHGVAYIPNVATSDLSQDSQWQYWNGATWTQFNVMVSESVQPMDQYADTPFERASGTEENMRFDSLMTSSWQKLVLNGNNKYWVRIILTNNILIIPEVTTFTLSPSYTLIGNDGRQQYFGFARVVRELVFHRKLLETINSQVPSNTDIDFTPSLQINSVANVLANNVIDAIGGTIRIPCGTCTACPLLFYVSWIPLTNNAGDVELEVEAAKAKMGDNINNSSLPSTVFSNTITVPSNSSGIMFNTMFSIPINTLLPHELVVVRIFRNATGGNPDDTLNGNISLVDVSGNIKYWT